MLGNAGARGASAVGGPGTCDERINGPNQLYQYTAPGALGSGLQRCVQDLLAPPPVWASNCHDTRAACALELGSNLQGCERHDVRLLRSPRVSALSHGEIMSQQPVLLPHLGSHTAWHSPLCSRYVDSITVPVSLKARGWCVTEPQYLVWLEARYQFKPLPVLYATTKVCGCMARRSTLFVQRFGTADLQGIDNP